MYEFNPSTLVRLNLGDFPLNHDCILKVEYIRDCGLRFQYFSCRAQDSGAIIDLISKLFCVHRVKVSSVHEFFP